MSELQCTASQRHGERPSSFYRRADVGNPKTQVMVSWLYGHPYPITCKKRTQTLGSAFYMAGVTVQGKNVYIVSLR